MKRLLITLATTSVAVAALCTPAGADPAPVNVSYAAAARITPGAGLSPVINTSGAVGGLLDFATPVLNWVVSPLTSQLTALPSTLVADLVGGLTGSAYVANSPGAAQAAPAGGYPDCASGTWNADDCYGPLVPTVSAAPVVSVGTGTLRGYAAADATGATAGAGTAGLALSLLGIDLGTLGVADASTRCAAGGLCTSSSSLTGLSLLGGAVKAKTAADGSLLVSLNGGAFAPVSSGGNTSISAGGLSATAVGAHGALQLKIALSLDTLLTALGITDVLSALNATDAGSTISLDLTIGTGATKSATQSSAWGIDVGIGVDVDVELSVLGLVTVSVVAPDTSPGSIVDLQLAYASAADTDSSSSSGAPPALT